MGFKSPVDVAKALEEIGNAKCSMSLPNMFLLAILAGAYIGFGAALATIVSHDTYLYIGTGFTKFLFGSAFSLGLILVVIGGAELFTGNNLIIVACLSKKVTAFRLTKNWIVVFIGNLIGSILLVLLMYISGLWKTNSNLVGVSALIIANAKVNLTFMEAFTRGILCNWLVCLAIWLAVSAEDVVGKIFGIYFPIMAFVASGYEHSVANMYFIPMGIIIKDKVLMTTSALPDLSNLTWGHFFIDNLIPVTLGNIVGGAIFVGIIYWFVYSRNV
ncbi:MAG: formate/nitrite transporter family protein [Candidatus Hodarchaeota archaeon]